MAGPQFVSVSFVNFKDEEIVQVAKACGTTEEVIREYLSSEGERNKDIDSAFYQITSMYPARKA